MKIHERQRSLLSSEASAGIYTVWRPGISYCRFGGHEAHTRHQVCRALLYTIVHYQAKVTFTTPMTEKGA